MKYIFDEAKFNTLVSEYKNSLQDNPQALVAAALASTKIRNEGGQQIQAKSAYLDTHHPQHLKARGLYEKYSDKFNLQEINAAEVLDNEVIIYKTEDGKEKEIKAISAYNNPDHPEHERAKAMYDSKKASVAKAKAKKRRDKIVRGVERGSSSVQSTIKKAGAAGVAMQKESTKEYEKSLRKIAKDRQMKMLTKKDKETLLKLARLMQKESINESIADEDMKAAKKLKSGLEKQIKNMSKAFDDIEKKVSSFNSPGLKAAYADAIKKSFQGNKFNSKLAINLLDAYFNR